MTPRSAATRLYTYHVTARKRKILIAVEAMKQGARDFLTKPLTDLPKLKSLLDDAERELEMRRKAKRLTVKVEEEGGLGDFIGASKAIREVFQFIESVAQRDVPVMIT